VRLAQPPVGGNTGISLYLIWAQLNILIAVTFILKTTDSLWFPSILLIYSNDMPTDLENK